MKDIMSRCNIISDQNRTTSNEKTIISDLENNTIFLDNFEFNNNNNIKSIGFVKIEDKLNNIWIFQIYIDTKKEILGTDIKAFINDENLKISPKNKPRVFK